MSDLFGRKALEICLAINSKTTFEYQETEEGYKWYLLMVNMSFFDGKLDWGTSIRGAWWNLYGQGTFKLKSCGFFDKDEEQLPEIELDSGQWNEFVQAMDCFVGTINKEDEK